MRIPALRPSVDSAATRNALYPPRVNFCQLGEQDRERRFEHMLGGIQNLSAVWVFAYGSLMWRPAFQPVECRRVRLPGFRRSFCFWTGTSRGSLEVPGLGLALEPGPRGAVGVAQRVDTAQLKHQLKALWEREMGSGVYQCQWLRVYTASGVSLPALSFVADPSHPQYARDVSWHCRVQAMARATGTCGSCRDYLSQLVEQLGALNAPDEELQRLLQDVDTHSLKTVF